MSDEGAVYLGANELHGGYLDAVWSLEPGVRVRAFVPVESVWLGGVETMGAAVVGMVRAARALPNDWTVVGET